VTPPTARSRERASVTDKGKSRRDSRPLQPTLAHGSPNGAPVLGRIPVGCVAGTVRKLWDPDFGKIPVNGSGTAVATFRSNGGGSRRLGIGNNPSYKAHLILSGIPKVR